MPSPQQAATQQIHTICARRRLREDWTLPYVDCPLFPGGRYHLHGRSPSRIAGHMPQALHTPEQPWSRMRAQCQWQDSSAAGRRLTQKIMLRYCRTSKTAVEKVVSYCKGYSSDERSDHARRREPVDSSHLCSLEGEYLEGKSITKKLVAEFLWNKRLHEMQC